MFIDVDGAFLILHVFLILSLLTFLFVLVEKYSLEIHVSP